MDAIVDISHVTFDIKQGGDYGREGSKKKAERPKTTLTEKLQTKVMSKSEPTNPELTRVSISLPEKLHKRVKLFWFIRLKHTWLDEWP